MDASSPTGRLVLRPFRASRLPTTHVGTPAAHRILARPYRPGRGRLLDRRRWRTVETDAEPALYVYEFTAMGLTVRGVVGTLDLASSAGSVFAHEGVDATHVANLSARMHQLALNPAPILLAHSGSESSRALTSQVARDGAWVEFTDRGGQHHRLWRITDPAVVERLVAALSPTRAMIADGHHRYAAALRLQHENPDTAWDHTLVMLVDQADSPLQLGAIHRSVAGVSLGTVERAAAEAGHHFSAVGDRREALDRLGDALVLFDGQRWAVLEPTGSPDVLPVCALHAGLLADWGADPARVAYHHTAAAAIAAAGRNLAVLLPAPGFDRVAAAAEAGILLPRKATSFQPKPHPGALIRDLRDE